MILQAFIVSNKMKLTYYVVAVVLLSCWCHNVVIIGDEVLDKNKTQSSTDVSVIVPMKLFLEIK